MVAHFDYDDRKFFSGTQGFAAFRQSKNSFGQVVGQNKYRSRNSKKSGKDKDKENNSFKAKKEIKQIPQLIKDLGLKDSASNVWRNNDYNKVL